MELLLRVLKWSLIAGALTALITALKPLLDRRLTPRWRYWLWLVLAAALLLAPVSPESLIPSFHRSRSRPSPSRRRRSMSQSQTEPPRR